LSPSRDYFDFWSLLILVSDDDRRYAMTIDVCSLRSPAFLSISIAIAKIDVHNMLKRCSISNVEESPMAFESVSKP